MELNEVDGLEITTLVDNQIDALLAGDEDVSRKPWGPVAHNPLIDSPGVATSLHAEHGFSALISVTRGDQRHTLLFDTGVSANGLVENMDRLELSPKDLEAVVLSHGHFDHTGGLAGLVERLGRPAMPLVLHPEAYTKRRANPPDGRPVPLPPPSRSALEGAGFELVETRDPSVLFAGALLVTGEVERTTSFEHGFPFFERQAGRRWQSEPHVMDDQAIVVNVRDKGLVVLSGCGHAGIVNVVEHARKITGKERVYGVLGGFHLSGSYFEAVVGPTVEALQSFEPAVIVPAHCTGYRAQMAIARALPTAYIHNAVGTTYRF